MPNEDLEKEPDDLDIGFQGKKKKKKKAAEGSEAKIAESDVPSSSAPTPSSAPEQTTAEPVPEAEVLDEFFIGKKKPSKKKTEEEKPPASSDDSVVPTGKWKKKPIDLDAFEKELEEDDDEGEREIAPASDSTRDGNDDEVSFAEPAPASDDPWSGSDRDYTYPELVDRVFRIIRQANPDADGGKKRYTMIPPQVVREGTKKTVFANLSEICKRMHRQPEHVISFLFSELGTTGSVDGSQRLVIKGRFQPPQIETVLKSYIIEYVTCKICKSPDTVLTKENRLTFMQCQACGAKRSVASIKSGFSAQVESRKKAM